MRYAITRVVRFGGVGAVLLFVALGTASWMVGQVAVREAEQNFPPPGRMVDVGGRLQHIHCIGTGTPTVILESGLDDRGSWAWSEIHGSLARISRTCGYDRAGLLWSEPGELPRDAERIATELRLLLAAAGESPPYVMVAHSLGALYARVYDDQSPGQLAGFVLVDPSHPEQEGRFPAEVQQRLRESDENKPPRWLFRIVAPYRMFAPERPTARTMYWWRSFPEGVLGEGAAIQSTFAQAARTGPVGDRPLIILTSGVKPELPRLSAEVNEAFHRAVVEGHGELAGLSTNSSHRVVDGAGHYIHVDRPDAVVVAVRDVVTAVQQNTSVN